MLLTALALAGSLNVNSDINTNEVMQNNSVLLPDGAIMAFNSTSCPDGWVEANGSTNGSPDLRGVFIRGYGTSSGYADNSTSLGIGMKQNDALQKIIGTFDGNTDDGAGPKAGAFYHTGTTLVGSNGDAGGGIIGFDSSKSPGARTDIETRPKNVALLYCMKQ